MKRLVFLIFLLIFLGCSITTPDEYLLEEKDLVPEGIAYSRDREAFYLTSLGKSKIVKVDRSTGRQSDFITAHQWGYMPGVGIYADDERNLLYALGGYYMKSDSLSSLFSFDLKSGNLVKRCDLKGRGGHFLNDLIMDKEGRLYLTDTKGSSLYVLNPDNDSLELFFRSPEIEFPNGIALSDDNSKLYIASASKGVRILDVDTREIRNGADTTGMSQGIDGLEFYNNHLYAVQNGVRDNGYNFRKLILNPAQDAVIDFKVIDRDGPNLNLPLTFCLAEDEAIVIGNSNLQYLNQESYTFGGLDVDSIPKTKLVLYPLE